MAAKVISLPDNYRFYQSHHLSNSMSHYRHNASFWRQQHQHHQPLLATSTIIAQDSDATTVNFFEWQQVEESDELHWWALLLLVFVLSGMTGNVLVCVAIAAEKRLQNITNYFLMSLALADLLVSIIVMPCAIANELMGKFLNIIIMHITSTVSSKWTCMSARVCQRASKCV